MDLKKIIRSIPDFPKKGVVFRDITPLLRDGQAFRHSVDLMADHYSGVKIDAILGAEARGFVFGAAMAYKLGVGFIPIRKPGKLPYNTCQVSYSLEYGENILEMHTDAIKPGDHVLIVDDLVATGGTAKAKAELVERMKGVVIGFCFLIELKFLNPRKMLGGYDIFSIIEYESE
ncbi:MAG: adenine phosphoribosyltransferase [Actinomycetota bacterium]|nr:adenine phosphoribosyltransferase [Actinomycetota bacterium]